MPYQHIYPIADGVAITANGVTLTPWPVITADGNYPNNDGFVYPGGTGVLEVFGTFGAGTAKLQMRGVDGVTWLDLGASLSVTAPTVVGFVAPNRRLRLNVAGSAGASLRAAVNKVTGD